MNFPPNKQARSCQSDGFTLIELLTVIALVGILVALLFPGLRSVKARAEGAKCLSNLKQIGVAVASYAGENNGAFPRGGWGDATALPLDPPATDGIGWLTDIFPYLNERREVFICPAGKEASPTGATSWIRMPGKSYADPRYPMHYAYNAQLNSNRAAFRNNNPVLNVDRVAAVGNLSGLPIMIDIVFQNNFYGGVSTVFNPEPPATAGEAFAARHQGTGNILWGDGRVTAMTAADWSAAPDERVKTAAWRRYRFCMGEY